MCILLVRSGTLTNYCSWGFLIHLKASNFLFNVKVNITDLHLSTLKMINIKHKLGLNFKKSATL